VSVMLRSCVEERVAEGDTERGGVS
jgi:hypothetical protein